MKSVFCLGTSAHRPNVVKHWRVILCLIYMVMRANTKAVNCMNDLILNISRLHTTEMGRARIRRNLGVVSDDVVPIVRDIILSPGAWMLRRGKNWYVTTPEYIITVNAGSFTIITAHRAHTK